MKRIIYSFLLIVLPIYSFAYRTLSDSSRISMLTCSPGTETYSKYGHSAIRVVDEACNMDWTFNYGVFSFNTDNFYLRFIQGQTYYQLSIEQTYDFIVSSAYIGRTTYEQQLDLTQEQKQALFNALMLNYEPQNRKYLYNFVFDNCATRPYHLLSRVLEQSGDTLINDDFYKRTNTFRERITYYSEQNSWSGFGINLLFGKDADKTMTTQERLFLPEELMDYIAYATTQNGKSICQANNTEAFEIEHKPFWCSPDMMVIIVCIVLICLTIYDFQRKKQSWWADGVIFSLAALLGIVLVYLSYFSIHPLVKNNYNLLLINPLLLFLPIAMIIKKSRLWLSNNQYLIGLALICLLIIRIFSGQTWHNIFFISIVESIRLIALSYKKNLLSFFLKKPCCRIFLCMICMVFPFNNLFSSPKLTVVIDIEGFNQSAMEMLRPYWQAGGLRILDEKAHKSQISFNHYVYGGSETLATIITGANPSTHGIASDTYFSRTDRKKHNIFDDNKEVCIGCQRHLSPRALLSPTVTDEFRQLSTARSRIFAIGQHAEATILLAGHSADACAWLDTDSTRWVTTGYYTAGLPAAADQMNINGRMEQLAARQWQPKMDINAYMRPTEEEKKNSFNYNQKDILLKSPIANTMVIELALDIQKEQQLGTRQTPDMLLLQLNVCTPSAQSDMLTTAEQEDMYLCLNQDLGFLIEQLDKRIGKENYRIVMFSTPKFGKGKAITERGNMPVNSFNTDRAAALINTYLMAIYGHERWIDGGYEQSIYLNRMLAEQKKMSIRELQQQVSEFMLEFSGVQNAFPASKLLSLQSDDTKLLQNTYNKQQFGDVVFTLQPLWTTDQDCIIEQNITSPLYIWTQERISFPAENIDATQVKQLILK